MTGASTGRAPAAWAPAPSGGLARCAATLVLANRRIAGICEMVRHDLDVHAHETLDGLEVGPFAGIAQ